MKMFVSIEISVLEQMCLSVIGERNEDESKFQSFWLKQKTWTPLMFDIKLLSPPNAIPVCIFILEILDFKQWDLGSYNQLDDRLNRKIIVSLGFMISKPIVFNKIADV